MFFWKWKKKEKSFETKLKELDVAVLTEKDLGQSEKVKQYVVDRLEQIISLTREIEDEKAEYQMVTSYLNDIQTLEELTEEEHKKIAEIATNVVQLNAARNAFLNTTKKLTDTQFAQLEREEEDIPKAIRRLSSNETYRTVLNKDLKYLGREKSEWLLHREYLSHQQISLRNILYVLAGLGVLAAVVFLVLQLILAWDMYNAWMLLVFVEALGICGIYLKIQNNSAEIAVAEKTVNRAIILENKVKLRYVNIANAIDYACEKYHVKNADELNRYWEYYMEAVKEREKYQRTNDDLEYFNSRLIRELTQYALYDTKVWVTQAIALVDAREMVEVKHNLVQRRQKLRGRMEANISVVWQMKEEAEELVEKVGEMRPQVEEVLDTIDQLELPYNT